VLLIGIIFGVFRPRADREDRADRGAPDDTTAPDAPAVRPAVHPAARPARIVPDTVRIKVEVINATSTRGLARLATAWLRDQGFDVVATGTAPQAEHRDSSLVLVRSGRADWGALAAKAIGGARVESRPDSLRYLDLTILVGRAWRAPPQSLYP